MKKDPSFLFYPAAWLVGTLFMTDQERGIYINLLCAQHQHGFIEKEYFDKTVGEHTIIRKKFKECTDGYYNLKLDEVISERKDFKKKKLTNLGMSDRESLNSDFETSDRELKKEALGESGSVDININRNKKGKSKKFEPPTEEEVLIYFRANGFKDEVAKRAFKYYTEMEWHDSKGSPIKSWKGKMVAVWFKEENRIFIPGKVNLTQMSDERKNHTS
jgi:hypothetical protein